MKNRTWRSWTALFVFASPKIVERFRGLLWRCAIVAAGGRCGRGLRVGRGVAFRYPLHAGIDLGDDIYIGSGSTIDCPPGNQLAIEDGSTLTQGVFLGVSGALVVGARALIGEYTSIRTGGHGIEGGAPIYSQPMSRTDVTVGRDTWIGRGVAILPGVAIGPNVVVGANSVVSHSLAEDTICFGVPAVVKRQRS